MITLLLTVWACIGSPDSDIEVVSIHEWGVLEFGGRCGELSACPEGYIDDDGFLLPPHDPEPLWAPVIWFHGPPCTGTLTIEIYNSMFTALIPYPDSLGETVVIGRMDFGPFTAVWDGLEIGSPYGHCYSQGDVLSATSRLSEADNFIWAFELWRNVQASAVHHPSSDYTDSFIYYETDLYDTGMFDGDYWGYTGEAFYFYEDSGEVACVIADIPFAVDYGGHFLTDLEITEKLNSWCPGLFPDEVDALWNTWKPLLDTRCITDGETLLMFPLPDEQVEHVSSITFTPDNDITVQYDRLFLGLGALTD